SNGRQRRCQGSSPLHSFSLLFILCIRSVASLLTACICLSLSANAKLAGQTLKFQTVLTTGNGNCQIPTSNANGATVAIKDYGTNATALTSCVVPNGSRQVGRTSENIFGVGIFLCTYFAKDGL
ncbi:hypothetical protein DFH09DRAFT_1370602, partial [Mycena vulgaris]